MKNDENLYSLEKHQNKLLEMFIEINDFFEKNGIEYFMLGGTLLGAIRHKGFIPWDDDIDLGIPRKDYERMLTIPAQDWPQGLEVKSSNDLPYLFSKIVNKNTTLVENYSEKLTYGLYIDIFPLDYSKKNNFRGNRVTLLISLARLYKVKKIDSKEKYYWLKFLVKKIIDLFPLNVFEILFQKEMCRRSGLKHQYDYMGNFLGAWGKKEVVQASIYTKRVKYEFEGYSFYGPFSYDLYLSSLYGEYLQLPPIEKRVSHHDYEYINLNMPYKKYINQKSERG